MKSSGKRMRSFKLWVIILLVAVIILGVAAAVITPQWLAKQSLHNENPCPQLTLPTAKRVVDFHHQVTALSGQT